MSLVSVVIPAYNAGRWIERTVASVVAQTYVDIELIIVDDGSALPLPPLPGKVLRHSVNRGQAAAINTGVQAASGEYIAFLDADDIWAPEKIAKSVQALRDKPDALLVYTNGAAIDENDKPLWPLLPAGHKVPTPSELLMNCVIDCPAQVVVRASAITPFTEGLQSNDHDQWVRLRERGQFVYIDEPLSFYRKHSGQISLARRQWEDGFKILKAARKRYRYPLRVVIKRYAVLAYRLGEFDMRNGKIMKGAAEWLIAAVLDPIRAVGEVYRRVRR